MSSSMISNYMEFNENFQSNRNLTNANPDLLSYLNLFAQEGNMQDVSAVINAVNPGANLQVPRRQASGGFSRNALKQTQLKAFVEAHQKFLNSMIAAGNLEPLIEEKLRGRALSEGTPAISIDSLGPDQHGQSPTNRYKTELCRPFEENGKCKYGEKCQFAHGKHELRHMVRHPKYKTELCRTYHTTGLCPYGPRCHFIHNQDEATLENQRIAASMNQIQRQNKPNNLQLATQLSGMNRLGSYPPSPPQINSPLEAPASFFFGGNDFGPISPLSPISKPNGLFNNLKMPFDEQHTIYDFQSPVGLDNRQGSPPLSFSELSQNECNVFDITPSDSDRESATGSPPGFGPIHVPAPPSACQQRLPIFRCLSQS